jgi:type I restriction enzyme S subunit
MSEALKSTPVGKIPKSWQIMTLTNFCHRVTDGTHDSPKRKNHGVKLVTSKNLKVGKIDLSSCYYISEKEFNQIEKRSKVDISDVIYGMIGTIGNPVLIKEIKEPFAIKNVALFKFNGDFEKATWLTYYLDSQEFIDRIEKNQTGNAQRFVGLGFLRDSFIPVPSDDEIEKITSILTSVDTVIEKTEAQINKLKDLKKAMMQELLTKGIGHAEFKDSPVGRIPVEWKVSSISEVSELITKGATPSTSGFDYVSKLLPDGAKFLRGNNATLEGKYNDNDNKFICEDAYSFLARSQLQVDDCIVTIVGTVGASFLVEKNHLPANINQNVAMIRLNRKLLHSRFLLECVVSEIIQNQIRREITVQAQPSLSLKQVGDFIIPLPPLNEQNEIATIASNTNINIASRITKLNRTKALKKALMQDLLTGKMRVLV